MNSSDSSVELFAPRTLTASEKEFVAKAMVTPNVDMHKAKKFGSDDGMHDMDSFYDHLAKQVKVTNARAHQDLKKLKTAATTGAVRKKINGYFDHMQVTAKKEHELVLHKEAGNGKASRAKMNLYFKHLDEAQAKRNEADAAKLRAEQKFHSKHGTAIAAMHDINSYFDQLSATEKQKDAEWKKKHQGKPLKPYNFLKPTTNKGGEAVHVHKHDEEGIQESSVQARSDINDYFDSLDRTQRIRNEKDRAGLSQHGEYAAKTAHLNTKAADKDIDSYFHTLKKTYSGMDSQDRARLRKDNNPVNFHEGVNLATHPLPVKPAKGAKKEVKEGAKARVQAKHAA